MEQADFHVSLGDFPGLFVVPAVTTTGDGIWEGVETPLYREFKEEFQRQWYAQGQCDYGGAEWVALNALRDAYAGVDDEKSMTCANAMLARSFMDEYVLLILGNWRLETNLQFDNWKPNVNLQEGVKSLLLHAERYASMFCVRAACLLQAAEILIQHHLLPEARRLFLAVLASTDREGLSVHHHSPYMITAEERYFQIQDDEQNASPNRTGFNPISRTQEALLRLRIECQNLGSQSDLIVARAQNAIRFKGAPGREDEIGGTRFGGLPDVPPGWVWPDAENGMEFLAQFNLVELAPFDHNSVLPRYGLLSIFVRDLNFWMNDGLDCLVRFYDGDMNLLQPAEAPEEFEFFNGLKHRNNDAMIYGAASVEPYSTISIVDGYTLYIHEDMDGHLADQIGKVNVKPHLSQGDGRGWQHHFSDQVLGFYGEGAREAWSKQTGKHYYSLEPHEKAEANRQIGKWVLLAEIESHDELGMMFSDAGIFYLMIHQDDLAARRFDRVFITMTNG